LFVDWFTQRRFEFYLDLHERLKECGHTVKIVDLSAFTFPQQSRSFNRSIHLDKTSEAYATEKLEPRLSKRPVDDDFTSELHDSIRAHLATKFNGQTNRVSQAIDSYILRMMSASLYSQLPEINSSGSIWIFQNGRLPHQRALLAYCKLNGVKHLVIESNLYWKSHYWARPYPPHDRESLQKEADPRKTQLDTAQRTLANKWFLDQASPQSKINEFTKRFQMPRKKINIRKQTLAPKKAVIFTSSTDEFVGLGEYWPWTGWNSQYESFSHIAKILIDLGYSITLRIHPNLQNKSLRAIREEYSQLTRFFQECELIIIGPQSSVNSYDLVDSAEVVVVSGSTIGLEALHNDKKVIVTESSIYDMLPGVLKINPKTARNSIIGFLTATPIRGQSIATEWVALQMSLGWSAKERPGLLRKNSIVGKLKYLLNWTFLLDALTLLVPRFVEALPKRALLRRIRQLENVQSL
jgi:hypothetical protein